MWVPNLESSPGEIRNRSPYMECKEGQKKGADHSRSVSGRELTQVQVLSWVSVGGADLQPLPARTLKIYTEALTGFSHLFSLDGLNNTLFSPGFILEPLLAMEMVGGTSQRQRGDKEASHCQGPDLSTSSHIFSMTFSNKGTHPS